MRPHPSVGTGNCQRMRMPLCAPKSPACCALHPPPLLPSVRGAQTALRTTRKTSTALRPEYVCVTTKNTCGACDASVRGAGGRTRRVASARTPASLLTAAVMKRPRSLRCSARRRFRCVCITSGILPNQCSTSLCILSPCDGCLTRDWPVVASGCAIKCAALPFGEVRVACSY